MSRNTGEGEREVEEDDLTTAFYENDEIDLGQLMREQFYLSLPMKPLCRRRLQGALPDVRHELESRRVRLLERVGRSQARGAEDAQPETSRTDS